MSLGEYRKCIANPMLQTYREETMRNSPLKREASRRSLRERWRMSLYLSRFEWHLEGFLQS
ncbi:hypothetical protein GCM10025778_31100 [Paeniglutamicibacter antarcticus]|uniref:Uncharacterized protein n=1 Tax=Paeniglutamicibacter antarcticus TaxID=494023 RepID=A0ABP9TPP5_9MICC